MVLNLLTAISNKIYDTFGKDYTIYTEKQEQGFKEGSFFIKMVNCNHNARNFEGFEREYTIEILYFPYKTNDRRKECNEIADKLVCSIQEIKLKDCIIFSNGSTQKIVDGVLTVLSDYRYLAISDTEDESEYIENLYFNYSNL